MKPPEKLAAQVVDRHHPMPFQCLAALFHHRSGWFWLQPTHAGDPQGLGENFFP